MKGFFTDAEGNKSMMRLNAFIATVGGVVGLLMSIALKSVQGMITSAGVIGIGQGAKLIQKKIEAK